LTHAITGDEKFLHRTLASIGIPPLHVLRAHNAAEYRFYELTGDLADTLHFRDFEGPAFTSKFGRRGRIRIGEEVQIDDGGRSRARGRVVFRD
jgi:hypothetical protein